MRRGFDFQRESYNCIIIIISSSYGEPYAVNGRTNPNGPEPPNVPTYISDIIVLKLMLGSCKSLHVFLYELQTELEIHSTYNII